MLAELQPFEGNPSERRSLSVFQSTMNATKFSPSNTSTISSKYTGIEVPKKESQLASWSNKQFLTSFLSSFAWFSHQILCDLQTKNNSVVEPREVFFIKFHEKFNKYQHMKNMFLTLYCL